MHGSITDTFDPRVWPIAAPTCEIRLCNRDASLVAIVDPEDYDWARRFTWGYAYSKLDDGRLEKFYAKTWMKTGPRHYDRVTVFLHKAILLRAMGPAKHPAYRIADHRDGESLNCRRGNLRWATPRMNRMNLFGAYPSDLLEDLP